MPFGLPAQRTFTFAGIRNSGNRHLSKAPQKALAEASRLQLLVNRDDHVEGGGRLLFEQIVEMDLEGIVCKRKDSPYKVTEQPSRHWIKVRTPDIANWRGGRSCLSVPPNYPSASGSSEVSISPVPTISYWPFLIRLTLLPLSVFISIIPSMKASGSKMSPTSMMCAQM